MFWSSLIFLIYFKKIFYFGQFFLQPTKAGRQIEARSENASMWWIEVDGSQEGREAHNDYIYINILRDWSTQSKRKHVMNWSGGVS